MKTTLCLMLLLICTTAVQADWVSVSVPNCSFEQPGAGKIKGWDEALGAYYTTDSTPAEVPGWFSDSMPGDSGVETSDTVTAGSYKAYLRGEDDPIWQTEPNIIGQGDVFKLVVQAWSAQSMLLTIYYYDDSANQRIPIASQSFDTDDTPTDYTLTASADDVPACYGHRVGIEIDNNQGYWLAIDNVRFYYNPAYVHTVSPVNGATQVDTNANLEWQANGWPVDLYFATDPNLAASSSYKKLSQSTVSIYDPGTLAADTTYYWKIAAYEPNELGAGYMVIHETSVASFTTISANIAILTQPQDTQCDRDQTATFTVDASSTSTIHYQWYKYTDDPNDSDIAVGTDSKTLILADADAEDEGYYYCVLANSAGSATTEQAYLDVQILLAHWTFDDTLDEATGTGLNGVMFNGGDPQYVTGLYGSALNITASGEFVNVPGTENLFDMNTQDMTVAVWVKTTQWNWGDMVTKCTRTSPKAGWTMRHAYDNVDSAMHSSSPGSELKYYANLTDDKWHLVVLTFNAQTSVMTLYATYTDSEGTYRIGKAATSSLTTKTSTTVPLRFGVSAALDGTSIAYQYIGALDDVRIYDYAMDEFQIAQKLYYPATGQGICLATDFASQKDFNSDCLINLADVAEMAAQWLSSGLYPAAQ